MNEMSMVHRSMIYSWHKHESHLSFFGLITCDFVYFYYKVYFQNFPLIGTNSETNNLFIYKYSIECLTTDYSNCCITGGDG